MTDDGDPPRDEARATRATRRDSADVEAATRKNRYNMMWEATQAFLAISLTLATIYTSIHNYGPDTPPGGATPETLKNALFVVLGFYFGRTNHSRSRVDRLGENGNGGG